jgi:hypothetical protein
MGICAPVVYTVQRGGSFVGHASNATPTRTEGECAQLAAYGSVLARPGALGYVPLKGGADEELGTGRGGCGPGGGLVVR